MSAVEHRGIEYEIKKGIATNEWVWLVHTPTPKPKQGKIFGTRQRAVYAATPPSRRACRNPNN